mgnify:FL=1
MKTKVLILILLCFISFFDAQSHRFVYEYKFVPDSTKIDSIIIENTRLEVFKDHSEFSSENSAKLDSVISKLTETNSKEIDKKFSVGKFRNNVWKSKSKMFTTEFIGIESFKVLNEIFLDWKLTKESKVIQNYQCQKATLYYGNRNWEIWFTTEIPIQDGPYIFRNLPGLIVQANDTMKNHSFLLIGNYKSNTSQTIFKEKPFSKSYEVNREQFNRKWREFRKNPIGGSEQFMLMNPNIISISKHDENGNEKDINDVRAEERQQAKRIIKNQNNFIDLQLYK